MVFLDEQGHDRFSIGEKMTPQIDGEIPRNYEKLSTGFGLTLYDSLGNDRGGMGFLSNGNNVSRAVFGLDRPKAMPSAPSSTTPRDLRAWWRCTLPARLESKPQAFCWGHKATRHTSPCKTRKICPALPSPLVPSPIHLFRSSIARASQGRISFCGRKRASETSLRPNERALVQLTSLVGPARILSGPLRFCIGSTHFLRIEE